MAEKEKKSGCFSTIFKAFAAFMLLSIIISVGVALKDKAPETPPDKTPQKTENSSPDSKAPSKPSAQTRPSTPAVEPLPDLATVPRTEWPREVKTREAMKFVSGVGSVEVPAGAIVKLAALSGDTVSLDFQGARANTKAQATDVAERIRDARKAVREAAIAKQKADAEAARLAAEKSARSEAERKAAMEANRKQLEAEIGDTPILGGLRQNEPPRVVQRNLKQVLKDPDSVQYIEASQPVVTQLDGQKCWSIMFRYRAKNSFGGYAINTAVAYIRNGSLISLKNVE